MFKALPASILEDIIQSMGYDRDEYGDTPEEEIARKCAWNSILKEARNLSAKELWNEWATWNGLLGGLPERIWNVIHTIEKAVEDGAND